MSLGYSDHAQRFRSNGQARCHFDVADGVSTTPNLADHLHIVGKPKDAPDHRETEKFQDAESIADSETWDLKNM
ncbi:MAG: hypothetical protein AAB919_00030 [Patescibacteria group bacterium]